MNFLLADKKVKSFNLDSAVRYFSAFALLLLAQGPFLGTRMQVFFPGFTLDYLLLAEMRREVGGKPSGPRPG